MKFEAEVEVPKNCTGELQYLQLLNRCHHYTTAGNSSKRIKTGGDVLDTTDPYEKKAVTSAGKATIETNDNPEGGNAPGNKELFIDDYFKMWLLWQPAKPPKAPRVPLAMVKWDWSAKANKTGSSGTCASDWTLSGKRLNDGKGSATNKMPTWTKTYPTDFPYENGTC